MRALDDADDDAAHLTCFAVMYTRIFEKGRMCNNNKKS